MNLSVIVPDDRCMLLADVCHSRRRACLTTVMRICSKATVSAVSTTLLCSCNGLRLCGFLAAVEDRGATPPTTTQPILAPGKLSPEVSADSDVRHVADPLPSAIMTMRRHHHEAPHLPDACSFQETAQGQLVEMLPQGPQG